MNENHTLETILAGLGETPVPADVHELAERVTDEFREGLTDEAGPLTPPVPAPARAPLRRPAARWRGRAGLAACILILVGLGGLLSRRVSGPRQPGMVFAEVVRHFVDARSARYRIVIELEGHGPVTLSHEQDFENRVQPYNRSGPMGIQMLPRDFSSSRGACDPMSTAFQGRTLYLFGKTDGEGMQDFFQVMGRAHQQARAELGRRNLDGRVAAGFRFEEQGTGYSIWAAVDSGLPLQVEITNPQLLGRGRVTLKDFEFDVDIDMPQLGMAGFDRRRWRWSLDEGELVGELRRWAKRHRDELPPCLVHQAWFFEQPDEFMNPEVSVKDKQFAFARNTRVIVRGVAFANQLPPGDHWRYLGKGLTVDAADDATPVCWYQPEGSTMYRVIYRNLAVRDLPPGGLPTTTAPQ
jgi:hypothetical protein